MQINADGSVTVTFSPGSNLNLAGGQVLFYGLVAGDADYERLFVRVASALYDTNAFRIGTEKAGTGVARAFHLEAAAGAPVKINGDTVYLCTQGQARWLAGHDGHWQTGQDGAYDIGAPLARPRNIFMTSSVVLKTKPGTPTDADVANPADGMMVVDTAANKLWVRVGGMWRSVLLT